MAMCVQPVICGARRLVGAKVAPCSIRILDLHDERTAAGAKDQSLPEAQHLPIVRISEAQPEIDRKAMPGETECPECRTIGECKAKDIRIKGREGPRGNALSIADAGCVQENTRDLVEVGKSPVQLAASEFGGSTGSSGPVGSSGLAGSEGKSADLNTLPCSACTITGGEFQQVESRFRNVAVVTAVSRVRDVDHSGSIHRGPGTVEDAEGLSIVPDTTVQGKGLSDLDIPERRPGVGRGCRVFGIEAFSSFRIRDFVDLNRFQRTIVKGELVQFTRPVGANGNLIGQDERKVADLSDSVRKSLAVESHRSGLRGHRRPQGASMRRRGPSGSSRWTVRLELLPRSSTGR